MTTLDSTTNGTSTDDACGTDGGGCTQGYLGTHLPSFTASLEQLDAVLLASRTVDAKTDELIRFALSIKARSEPCVRKHFVGAMAAGASEAEISYVFALTMRESAGADDCWTHGIISSLTADATSEFADDESASCCG